MKSIEIINKSLCGSLFLWRAEINRLLVPLTVMHIFAITE